MGKGERKGKREKEREGERAFNFSRLATRANIDFVIAAVPGDPGYCCGMGISPHGTVAEQGADKEGGKVGHLVRS